MPCLGLQALNGLSSLPEELFEDTIQETFVTKLSDGSQVELLPGGANKDVTFENVSEFVDLVIQARLDESKAQARAIRKGFNHVVPVGMLSLFSWCVAVRD